MKNTPVCSLHFGGLGRIVKGFGFVNFRVKFCSKMCDNCKKFFKFSLFLNIRGFDDLVLLKAQDRFDF